LIEFIIYVVATPTDVNPVIHPAFFTQGLNTSFSILDAGIVSVAAFPFLNDPFKKSPYTVLSG
jgi:hypothetical protein